MTQDEKWMKNYELAKAYYNHHKNLNIPYDFKTKNGYTKDLKGFKLGKWLYEQKKANEEGRLKPERKKLLEEIGANLKINTIMDDWSVFSNLIQTYYNYYGNTNIPDNFKTKDGITEDKEGFPLKEVLDKYCKKATKKNFSRSKKEFLTSLGITIEEKEDGLTWQDKYKMLKRYQKKYGNIKISRKFKTLNGVDYDENGIVLIEWVYYQQKLYKMGDLNSKRKNLLEKVGVDFNNVLTLDARWMKMYKLAKKYYEHYKDLNIPSGFKTIDGVTHNKKGEDLERWIRTQNTAYRNGKLSEEKIKLLLDIKMVFREKNQEELWQEKYELLENFYKFYHHTRVPENFKTKNGKDYDEDGLGLYNWFLNQKSLFKAGKLKPERFIKLSAFNVCWSVKKDTSNIENICTEYSIDSTLNKDILNQLNHYELNAKIHYLIANNLPLTSNGRLHEIFSMCSVNMKQKYNIDYEGVIINFYNKDYCLERKAS